MNRPNTAVEPHQLLDDIVIAFLSFLETHIFPNGFNYLWSVFRTIPVICLFLSLSFGSDLVVDDIRKLPFIFTCPFIWHFFLTKEENYVSIIITSNVIIILYLWNTRPWQKPTNSLCLISMRTMMINQYNENETDKRTFEQVDWIDECFKWMCLIKTFHYQDANSQCIQCSSVCRCLSREKKERDTR